MTPLLGPIFVEGRPLPKGSLKNVAPAGRTPIFKNDNPALDDWEQKITDTVGWQAGPLRRQPITGPVEMTLVFHMVKARTTKFVAAPIGHGQGDLDKLTRTIGDALTAAKVWTDDALVARIITEKIYAPGRAGVEITLWPYVPPPAAPSGSMPVRLLAGRINAHVGSVGDVRGLPNLLRQVAGRVEEHGHAT